MCLRFDTDRRCLDCGVRMHERWCFFQVQQCADGTDSAELRAEGHADAHGVPGEGGARGKSLQHPGTG